MERAKAGDRVVIDNKRSSYHERVGDVTEVCGPAGRFDVKVKFAADHREHGFWFEELIVLPS